MRKRCIALFLVVGLAVAAFIAWCLVPRPGVTYANFERLRTEMTRNEVQDILGPQENGQLKPGKSYRDIWYGQNSSAIVTFDVEDTVIDLDWNWDGDRPLGNTHLAKFRRWLGF
jgi:hypothetical protein